MDFFSNGDFPSRICCDFFRSALFLEKHFFTRLQNNYFNATVNFSEQVFLQSSCFFEELLFQYCYLCTAVNFSESHFFRAKLLLSSHFLRIEGSLGQLLFGAGTFLAEDFFRIKISTECHPFEAGCTTSTFSEEHNFGKSKLFRKAIFHITSLFWRASYLERLLFSKDATFCSSYLFRRAIFFTAYFFRKITIWQLLFLSRAILLWNTIVTYFRNTYISNERPSISIQIPSISIKMFGFRSKC